MMRFVLVAALAALPLLSAADHASAQRPVAAHARAPRYSQEKLDRMRQALSAQIAVRDDAEGAMRAPTAEEAAAFALAPGGASETIALPTGGVALRSDGSQLSLAVARVSADGTVTVTHGAASAAPKASVTKGAAHDR